MTTLLFVACAADPGNDSESKLESSQDWWQSDPFVLKRHKLNPAENDEWTLRLLRLDGSGNDASRHDTEVESQGIEWVEGVMGGAARFEGGSRLEMIAPDGLENGFSVEAWVWVDRPEEEDIGFFRILEWPGAFAAGFEVQGLQSGGRLRPQMEVRTTDGTFTARTVGNLPFREWFHIRFTYDPTKPSLPAAQRASNDYHSSFREGPRSIPAVAIQVNGVHVGDLTTDSLRERFLHLSYNDRKGFMPTGTLLEGKGPLIVGREFRGKIDDLRISSLGREDEDEIPWLSGRWGDFVPYQPAVIHPSITGPADLAEAMQDQNAGVRLIAVEAVPMLQSIGLYVRYAGALPPAANVGVRYRKKGEEQWMEGMDLVADRNVREFRGSLLNLEENTEYEVMIFVHGAQDELQQLTMTTRTWSASEPVAEVRELPAGTLTEPLVIRDVRGNADGWILYRPAADSETIIDVRGTNSRHAVVMDGCAYVILEGLTVRGGDRHGFHITDSHDIRIRRNDISKWSLEGEKDPDNIKGLYLWPGSTARLTDTDGIRLGMLTSRIVVEDNFIHSPRSTATCWRYGHPVGPLAMTLNGAREVVIRNNDMVGNEDHWFDDVIQTTGHQSVHGGIYRDVDINGNFLAFAQDNHVELDGGVMNARFWDNRLAFGYREIALAPTIQGPGYVFFNVVEHRGDEFLRTGSVFKTGWPGRNFGRTYLMHNTVVSERGPGAGNVRDRPDIYVLDGPPELPGMREVFAVNNLALRPDLHFDPRDPHRDGPSLGAEIIFEDRLAGDYRLAAGSLGSGAADGIQGFTGITGGQLDFGALQNHGKEAPMMPERSGDMRVWPQNVEVNTCSGEEKSGVSELVVDISTDAGTIWRAHPGSEWIRIEPDSGPTGGEQKVSVFVDASDLQARTHRGVITFRTNKGLNRSVTLQAHVRHSDPWMRKFEPEEMAEVIPALEAVRQAEGVSGAGFVRVVDRIGPNSPLEFEFDAPRADSYHVLARFRAGNSARGNPRWSLDGSKPEQWHLSVSRGDDAGWQWYLLDPHADKQTRTRSRGFELTEGAHVFQLSELPEGMEFDCLVISNEPFPIENDGKKQNLID